MGSREKLREYLDRIPVIDAHEHLQDERAHIGASYTFFNLFIPYIMFDLYPAGMPREWLGRRPMSPEAADEYWKKISPIWNYVKHGSYARSTLRALKEFWDIDDITDSNYREIGELLNATRVPGHYRKVLVEKCGFTWVLNQARNYSHEEPFMKGAFVAERFLKLSAIRSFIEGSGGKASFDEFCVSVEDEMARARACGAVQVKFDVSHEFCGPLDRERAAEEFNSIKSDPDFARTGYINAYVSDRLLSQLPKLGMPAAVHTGVWDDIRTENPEQLYHVVAKHPEVNFDIYHLGIPYVHECGFLGKNYHNAYLNLCWSHIVAPEMMVRALGELLDYVPTNKVFGFGGDFLNNPEQTWGALQIAKENLSEVFAGKVDRGVMGMDDAEEILRLWMYENPARVYGLGQPG